MKKRSITKLVLVIPNLNKEMRVEANISDFVTEVVLSIKYKDKWKPVAYISKLLNKAERNYKIHDKDILVIIRYHILIWPHLSKLIDNASSLSILSDPF